MKQNNIILFKITKKVTEYLKVERTAKNVTEAYQYIMHAIRL